MRFSGIIECTGVSARWCPVHGDCTCKAPRPEPEDFIYIGQVDEDEYLEAIYRWEADPTADAPLYGLNDEDCPLHGRESLHAEDIANPSPFFPGG